MSCTTDMFSKGEDDASKLGPSSPDLVDEPVSFGNAVSWLQHSDLHV